MDDGRLARLAERLEPIRQALDDDWAQTGLEYDRRGDETRLSLVTRALLVVLNELKAVEQWLTDSEVEDGRNSQP